MYESQQQLPSQKNKKIPQQRGKTSLVMGKGVKSAGAKQPGSRPKSLSSSLTQGEFKKF